ncbi:MAG: zinc ribbon domain-containing protein [Nanoarchaeota archaeon]
MKCHNCHHENPAHAKFCLNCGNEIVSNKIEKMRQNQDNLMETKILVNPSKMNYKIFLIPLIILIIVLSLMGAKTPSKQEDSTQDSGGTSKSFIDNILKKAECGNNQCESGEDSSNCCMDCNCPNGYSCDRNSCKKLAQCGNGVSEEGETSENCCIDTGCGVGQTCQNNKCVELKPEIDASFLQTTESYSVTYLKSKGNNIGKITLTNTGNDDAINVRIVLSSANNYFSDKSIDFGTVYRNTPITKTVDLTFLDNVLEVTTDEDISIKAGITYFNSANKQYAHEDSFKMHIAGRNYMTWANSEMVASWVTSTQPTIREFATKSTAGLAAGMEGSDPIVQNMAARWLFESMRAYGVKYVNDAHSSADYVQFPIETLRNKAGDCDDNAVLYSSLLEAIGLKSFLMLVPGHIFSGYIDSRGYAVPIETTANNFESALSSGSSQYNQYKGQYSLIYPSTAWAHYPQVNLPEKTQINMPSITKQIGECSMSFNLADFWVAKVPVTFMNSGNAPGAGCAAAATYQNGQLRDQAYNCWTLNPGETKQENFEPDISFSGGFVCRAY